MYIYRENVLNLSIVHLMLAVKDHEYVEVGIGLI